MKEVTKILYRYEMFHFDSTSGLELVEHKVLRRTPKGFWIALKYGREKWISQNARNRFAHKTKKAALKGFVRRKTYRNHCIQLEHQRNEDVITEAKILIRKDDEKRKK